MGSKNRATIIKEFLEEALLEDLQDDALEILAVAIRKAKQGDNQMIKMLLGDFLDSVRKPGEGQGDGGKQVVVTINNMTREQQDELSGVTIEQRNPNE